MALVIVESYTKVPKLKKILPKEYEVIASGGHIMDLDPKTMSLDTTNFVPTYVYYPKSKDNINKIKKAYKEKKHLIIASDLDREGEFIAESFKQLLKTGENYDRIVFNEITKKAILASLSQPSKIDYNKVHAQQTRRFMDRIFGYGVSPLLARIPGIENPKKLGCGRVQSGFVKLIIERENKIKEFFETDQGLTYEGSGEFLINNQSLKTYLINSLNKKDSRPVTPFNMEMLLYKVAISPLCTWVINNIVTKNMNKSPKSPYNTAIMQSDASTKLRWSVKKVMDIAQKLYEAGFITYMRTDATTLSEDALEMCKNTILNNYGDDYYCKRQYETNVESAQEAHEAIRPCDFSVEPEQGTDMYKLYSLIWNRTLASQMSNAIIETMKITLKPTKPDEPFGMVGNKSRYVFLGYTTVYKDEDEIVDDNNFIIDKHSNVSFVSMTVTECVKSPISRFTESQLVKAVTKVGIGRPGTTASFIDKILDKGYVRNENITGITKQLIKFSSNADFSMKITEFETKVGEEKNRMVPTKLGYLVNNFLEEHFPQIMDLTFTAKLEKQLTNICLGKENWKNVLTEFYDVLKPQMDLVQKQYNIQPFKKQEDEIIGKYNTENIYYIKIKSRYVIKTMVNNVAIWVNVKVKPTESEAKKLISNKVNAPPTTLIKSFGKKFLVKQSERGAFLQVQKGKKVKFIPLKSIDPHKITKEQCENMAKNFLK